MVVWQLTILGIAAFAFIVFALISGYKRGLPKEFYWAAILIVAAALLNWLFDLLVAAYNFLAGFVITLLNNRGITKIDPASAKWDPNAVVHSSAGQVVVNHGTQVAEIIIFLAIALGTYPMVSGKPKPLKPGEKPPSAKSILGAIVCALSVAFVISFIFGRLLTFGSNALDIGLFQNTNITTPSFAPVGVPVAPTDIQVVSKPNDPPFLGWDRWLPLVIAIIMFFYLVYVAFAKPATKTTTRLRIWRFVLLGISIAVILIFAAEINLIKY